MRELDQGELRDLLPDLVHGTLSDEERAVVERAVAGDPELARELEAVRAARGALTPRAVAIDTQRIVTAVGRPARRQGSRPATMSPARWRIAAAIATFAVGGASLAVVQRAVNDTMDPAAAVESTLVAMNELEISFGYDWSELADEDIAALLADLQESGGLPPAEPRNAVVPVSGGVQ